MDVISRALSNAQEWTRAQGDLSSTQVTPTLITQSPVISIPPDAIVCNTDAAWNPITKAAGIGWIFTAQDSQLQQGSESHTWIQSALQAEALAVRVALSHAIQLGYNKIWLRSDSLGLIKAIVSTSKPKNLYGILSDVETLSASFISLLFQEPLMGLQI